ncbi:MAG: ParA family protein [Betaproteobacteria bacterium]|nr:ParA family protein [Betaproteobacteria bacterium]
MKTIGFFNNKGGVGKTSLVYHLSWMFAEMGRSVVAADLDPQANLSAMFMDDEELLETWENGETIFTALRPLHEGYGDLGNSPKKEYGENLAVIIGDMRLSGFEDKLSVEWANCMKTELDVRAFRVETVFARIIQEAGKRRGADYALVDVGPNLGAINRAALLACDYVVTPVSPDLFSWQGLRNMAPALKNWREDWRQCREKFNHNSKENQKFDLPEGDMTLLGYVPMRFTIHASKPVKSYQKWLDRMPDAFAKLREKEPPPNMERDPNFLGMLKDYSSLMPMAQENQKPMFRLSPADGAFGAHAAHVQKCRQDFRQLAEKIIAKIEDEQ